MVHNLPKVTQLTSNKLRLKDLVSQFILLTLNYAFTLIKVHVIFI